MTQNIKLTKQKTGASSNQVSEEVKVEESARNRQEENQTLPEQDDSSATNRRYQISSNRGSATHKVRYVETGGGDDDEGCRVCNPTPKPR